MFPSGGSERPVRDGDPGVLLEQPGGGGSRGELVVLTGDRGGLCFPATSLDFFVYQPQCHSFTHADILYTPANSLLHLYSREWRCINVCTQLT